MINDPENPRSPYQAPAVQRAFALLRAVGEQGEAAGVSELARRLNLSKSTVHGLVNTLLSLGALVQDPHGRAFRLGPLLVELGRQAALSLSLERLAQPFLEQLSRELEETVFLGYLEGNHIVIAARAESPAQLKITAPPGTRIPFYAGATAKVLLGFLPEEELHDLLRRRPLPAFTPRSITDPRRFLAEVRRAREAGYAYDQEEYIPGVNAVSVPLPRGGEGLPAALWVVGFATSLTPEKLDLARRSACATAQSIAGLLGAGGASHRLPRPESWPGR